MIISVTLTRLLTSDLVITNDPFGTDFHLPEDGIGRPGFQIRRAYAPDSAYVPGRQLLAATTEASTLPLTVYAHGSSTADLQANMAVLEDATSQFVYDVTLTVDGVAQTWRAEAELPAWEAVDSGMAKAYLARASLVIPVNPT